jgi:hypothetical protein
VYLVHEKKIKTITLSIAFHLAIGELNAQYYFAIHILVINVDL